MEQYICEEEDVLAFFCGSESFVGAMKVLFTKIGDKYQVIYSTEHADKTLEIKMISKELFDYLEERYKISRLDINTIKTFSLGKDYDPLCSSEECSTILGETFPCVDCDKFFHKYCMGSNRCNDCWLNKEI